MKDANPETEAYAREVVRFYEDPDNDGKPPPRAPSPDVAFEYAAATARCLAIILDANRLGLPLASPLKPTPESTLQAAELIDEAADCLERFGEDVFVIELDKKLRRIFEEGK